MLHTNVVISFVDFRKCLQDVRHFALASDKDLVETRTDLPAHRLWQRSSSPSGHHPQFNKEGK